MAEDVFGSNEGAATMDIINNESNPSHAALHDENHADHARVKGLVESYFAKANPQLDAQIRGESNQEEGAPAEAELQNTEALNKSEWGEAPAQAVEAEVVAGLRQEYGDRFEESMGFGGLALQAAFGSWDGVENFVSQTTIGSDPVLYGEVMRTLVKIGAP